MLAIEWSWLHYAYSFVSFVCGTYSTNEVQPLVGFFFIPEVVEETRVILTVHVVCWS